MKTTVDVPDRLYRQIKARAALRGQTIKSFFIDAVREKLATEGGAANKKQIGWRAVFGKGNKEEVAEVQRIIDEEFSRIDPEGWE
jgi:hypothetical protein